MCRTNDRIQATRVLVVDVGRRSTCCYGSKYIPLILFHVKISQNERIGLLKFINFISGHLYFLLRAMGSSKIWRCRVSNVCTYPRLRHVVGINAMDPRICCLLPLYPTRQPKRRKNKEIFYTYLYWQSTYNNVQNYRLYWYEFFLLANH